MKKYLIGCLLILVGISVIGQPLTKEEYQGKSKNQRTLAWILTGGGIATAIGGAVITGSNTSYFPNETVGPIMIAGGGLAIVGGIILFSASKRNENKGNEMANFNLKMEKATVYTRARAENYHFPALSLRIWIN